ncbi:hypothetical protein [Sinorhizobium sp. RAC02]|uniref:hypothetical protein n=1 Tax=Sinorhizobium sp. RAC02 TaxID=1842534 RepID=UPI00083DF48E|nr:hypothetical protein [Sinorhizobium sp. RAC02]AOF93287.1 hypothetical protein BSY16_4082 [Sinorhizobium sp. RAC02]AOF94381.1 hypothetical protein BSY16_4129 [Sinorhizobium sp. RAC02]
MRMPQRSFVVEFNSRSRQTKASKPASIWADTDLKAVARQVEEQSAHLFDQSADREAAKAAASRLEAPPQVPSALQCSTLPSESETPMAKSQVTDVRLADNTMAKDVKNGPPETAGQPPAASETAAPAPQRMTVRKIKTRAVQSERKAAPRTAPAGGLNAQEAFASATDLAALEGENRRLKALLREHLSAEHAQLAAMLLRFQ